MLLCEEYLKRHSIRDSGVRYRTANALFIKPVADRSEWINLSIRWKDKSSPGSYIIKALSPKIAHNLPYYHNGSFKYKLGDVFAVRDILDIGDDYEGLHWDKFEAYFLDFAKKLTPKEIVIEEAEVWVSAWNMFYSSVESHLTNSGIKEDILLSTTDLSLDMQTRYNNTQDCLAVLRQSDGSLWDGWMEQMFPYINNYAYWLADLIALAK